MPSQAASSECSRKGMPCPARLLTKLKYRERLVASVLRLLTLREDLPPHLANRTREDPPARLSDGLSDLTRPSWPSQHGGNLTERITTTGEAPFTHLVCPQPAATPSRPTGNSLKHALRFTLPVGMRPPRMSFPTAVRLDHENDHDDKEHQGIPEGTEAEREGSLKRY